MTDDRALPRNINEPHEARRPGQDHGSDRSQGRERYESQSEGRSSSRFENQGEYGNGDDFGRERSSGASFGPQGQGSRRAGSQSDYGSQGMYGQGEHGRKENGQGLFGQGPYTGHQEQYGSQSSYRDRDRGGYRSSSSQPFSSEGERGSAFSTSRTHGPYSGKGPKGYKRSDQQICEDACQALERDGRVDASEIEVTCNSGVLKLTGKVENRAAKRDAEECIEDIYGVSDVMNELKVENGFFANLFGTGSNSDNDDHKNASKSSNRSSQKHI